MTFGFESKSALQLYKSFFPSIAESAFSITDLADSYFPLPENDRLQLLRPLLSEAGRDKAPQILRTLELLRESLILTHEHTDHCFTSLPPTPKNRRLRELLHQYLDSALAEDRTAQLWRLIGALKEKEISPDIQGEILLVRDSPNAFLLSEIAQALTYLPGVKEVRIIEPWQLGPETSVPFPVRLGTTTDCLSGLAETALSLSKTQNVLIPFAGKPESRFFLEMTLRSLGVSFESHFEEKREAEVNPAIYFIQKIREDISHPLDVRLSTAQVLLRKWQSGKWADPLPLEKWREEGIFTEAMWKCATQSSLLSSSSPKMPSRVTLLPFQPLPLFTETAILAFADNTVLEASLEDSLLTFGEIETLYREGFSLPRVREHRERALRTVKSFSERGSSSAQLFTTLDPALLADIATAPVERAPIPPPDLNFSDPHRAITPMRPLSATQLETYSQCPAKYFFANRLRLRRQLSRDDQYALLFGQAVHLTLEWFFAKKDQHDTSLSVEKLLPKLFDDALEDIVGKNVELGSLRTILRTHFEKVAPRFIKLEKQIQVLFPTAKPWALEAPFEIMIEGMKLTGKIDRLDRTDFGLDLIFDYKTGNVDFCPDHINEGYHFQALLYLLGIETLSKNPCAGILFYDLKKGELRRGILVEDLVSAEVKKAVTRGHTLKLEKWSQIKESGITHLRNYAARITAGDFTPTPDAQVCRNCDFVSLCRKAHGYV
jgi:hypothetical protein